MEIEWSVTVEGPYIVDGQHRMASIEDLFEPLHEELKEFGASLSFDETQVSATIGVNAVTAAQASVEAERIVKRAVARAWNARMNVILLEAQTMEKLTADLQKSNYVEMVGVSEIAELFGVSRQRASQIAGRRDFPAPYAQLKAGPIWMRDSLNNVLGTWSRKSGPRPGVVRRPTRSISTPERAAPVKVAAKSR